MLPPLSVFWRSVFGVVQRARLVFAPAVRAVLTEDVIREARASFDEYNCVRCNRPGNALRDLTSVILVKPGNFPHIMQCAHFDCIPSQVLEVPDFDPSRLAGQGEDVTYLKVAWEPGRDGHPYEAILLVDRPRGVDVVTGVGERAGIFVQELLGVGFELAMSLSQPFPAVSRYTCEIGPDGVGRFTDTDGNPGMFLEQFDTSDDLTGKWLGTVRDTGWITVLAGNLGLENTPEAQTGPALAAALKAGTVAGGRIRANAP